MATYAGQNVYTDSKNSPYASNLYVKTLTRALNGDTAPNIDKIWVKVTNTSDPNQSKEYVLYDNAKGTANYANNSLLDTIGDLPGAMDLTYEIHIKNTYGLEKVAETYTSRKIELYTTIEKVDTDINGEGDNTFSAGTRGILHVYTTGWVDNFNFTFPNDLNASWEFDKSLGYPVLTPSANDVFGFTTNDPNMTKYANKAYPSTIQNVPTLTGYKTYGDTGFIRCYDFYFWIPLTIDNPNNPNAEVVNDDTVWKIKTTARKFYNSKPTYKNGILTGQTTNNVVTSVSSVAAVGGDPKSVTKQFRTVIKKTG